MEMYNKHHEKDMAKGHNLDILCNFIVVFSLFNFNRKLCSANATKSRSLDISV